MMEITQIKQQGAVTMVWFGGITGQVDLMLSSDRHHDSMHCNRKLEKKQLDEAKKRQALIIDAGDPFDAMQGRYDPRRNYDDLRPEFKVQNYYDVIVNDALVFYKPYASNFLVIGKGNHDQGVLKHTNISLITNLVKGLREEGSQCVCGGYGGWVILYFGASGGTRSSVRIKYFHGAGSEAPVTRGMIQTNRQAVYLPDADIVLNGHNHQEYTTSIKRERISTKGIQYFDLVHFGRTPGYMDDYGDGSEGWAVESGHVPKPQGCIWAKIEVGQHYKPHIELTADVV